jgi:hypothetical protein
MAGAPVNATARTAAAGLIVIVHSDDDQLAPAVADELVARGHHVRRLAAARLAASPLTLTPQEARLEGEQVAGVVFLCRPDGDFGGADRAPCSNEARAAWLALLQLPTVVTAHRPDAELWYSSSEWSVWRRRLVAAGLPVADLVVGDHPDEADAMWLPWGGGVSKAPEPGARRAFAPALARRSSMAHSVWFGGECLDGAAEPEAGAAAQVLRAHGAELAGITRDAWGRVMVTTAHPHVAGGAVTRVAQRIGAFYAPALHRR